MPKITIPEALKKWFQEVGIDSLPPFIPLHFIFDVNPQTKPYWAYGTRVSKVILSTAGNVATNLSPGLGKRWIVLRGIITLTTDVTVANRYIQLVTTMGGVTESTFYQRSPATVASSIEILCFNEQKFADASIVSYATHIGIDPIIIDANDQFRIQITNGVAGDVYEGYVVVMEITI